jgi:hypothetical protein
MLSSLELVAVGPAPRLRMELAPRLNVLTGDNGLGKTFLLDVAWWALTASWAGHKALPQPGTRPSITAEVDWRMPLQDYQNSGQTYKRKLAYAYDAVQQRWALSDSIGWGGTAGARLGASLTRTPEFLLGLDPVIYARLDNGFSVWDPARNYQPVTDSGPVSLSGGGSAIAAPFHFGSSFSSDGLWNGLRHHGKSVCNGLIADWVNWQQQRVQDDDPPFAVLARLLEALSPQDERLLPGQPRRVFIDDARDFPTLDLPYQKGLPVIHASAGMQRILCLAYVIAWTFYEHRAACKLIGRDPARQIILLMDEVETHLHPRWQRRIVPALLDAIAGLGEAVQAQLLLTTHSPIVLASLEPHFIEEQDKLYLLELGENQVHLEEMDLLKTKAGDAVGWLASPIFKLEEGGRSLEAEAAIHAAEALMRGDAAALPDGLRSEELIHGRLMKVLPEIDPFWPRWIVHRERGQQ